MKIVDAEQRKDWRGEPAPKPQLKDFLLLVVIAVVLMGLLLQVGLNRTSQTNSVSAPAQSN